MSQRSGSERRLYPLARLTISEQNVSHRSAARLYLAGSVGWRAERHFWRGVGDGSCSDDE